MALEVLPATAARFADVSTLLAPKRASAPACWCLAYHLTSAENNALHGADRPAALRELCSRDVAPGMVAYDDGVPVGWCALGPRAEMGRLRPVAHDPCRGRRTGLERRVLRRPGRPPG